MIERLTLRNILSFGEDSEPFALGPLNVLIGPNGSGKSNVIEILALLNGAPRELAVPVREGGGIRDWLWKGAPNTPRPRVASIDAIVNLRRGSIPIRYRLRFTEASQRLEVVDERIESERPHDGHETPYLFFGYEGGRPIINVAGDRRGLRREDLDAQQSVLSQRKDPDTYPEITELGHYFGSMRFYREWTFGRYTPPRMPQRADMPNDALAEDCSNLGLVLNGLRRSGDAKRRLLELLRTFYADAEDVDVIVEGGSVQLFLHERRQTIPATRLSDGTLRWLSLLAILLHPSPPPLLCIEEPELGLHPDMMPTLAELLRDASSRSQLVVTTHSEALVDALTDTPDVVVVCEKQGGATRLRRLGRAELDAWLSSYSLGALWRRGELGGNRW